MQNEFSQKSTPNDSYNKVINCLAEQYAEKMNYDAPDPFLTPQAKKEKLKAEFLEQIKMPVMNQYLQKAMDILRNDAKILLSEEQFEKLQNEFNQAALILENFDYETKFSVNFARLLGISADTLNAIDSMAKKKFQEKPEEALSLLVLLSTLEEDNAENWHELGICFQQLRQFENAINAYTNCLSINPNHLGASAFLAECYLMLKERDKALTAYHQAKKLIFEQNADKKWVDFIQKLDGFIH